MKKSSKALQKSIYLIILIVIISYGLGYSQADKKVITLDDVKLWRSHRVTLSDNGQWYTVLYSLTEKPDPKKEKPKPKKDSKKDDDKSKEIATYGKNALTDVLYIRSVGSKKVYQIPRGSKPKFSPASPWIAYIIKPESTNQGVKKEEKKSNEEKNTIELRNLKTGKTKRWESNASFQFSEDGRYFLSHDKTSLLLCNLTDLKAHYIGNLGEFLLHKKSDLLVYTISSSDKRGNGIYAYHLTNQTTRALETGNYVYSNLAWNSDKNVLAAFKHKTEKKVQDPVDIRIITLEGVDTGKEKMSEYPAKIIKGIPKNMLLAVKKGRGAEVAWSKDNKRLFLGIKKRNPQDTKKAKKPSKDSKEDPSVDVWHWKDKKLVSQQMMEFKRKQNKIFRILFNRKLKKAILLTNDEIQRLYRRSDTDQWGIGTDNRAYISDWDVTKNDIYRINLITGERKLIIKNLNGPVHISPEGERAIFWRDGHYWFYTFKNHHLRNITENLSVSFLNKEHDYYGSKPAYGFVGWVKDENSVIVNHKLDLWLLSLVGDNKAINLTRSTTLGGSMRFRFNEVNFENKPEMNERYINLSASNILYAFDIKSKHSGYYQLSKNKLKKLLFKPASTNTRWWRWRPGLIKAKKAKALIFKLGSYQKYPESYLSNTQFSKLKKITTTNPQQKSYRWGRRILIDYTNDDGVPLQGILSIPDGYQTGQQQPMIVYTYEKLSDNFYQYPGPRISGASVSEIMYVSDGYLFLQPDIHFNIGTPHSDMHECIDAAIRKVMELGYVDEKHIGYQGFSFGGH